MPWTSRLCIGLFHSLDSILISFLFTDSANIILDNLYILSRQREDCPKSGIACLENAVGRVICTVDDLNVLHRSLIYFRLR
jgi:hypothetical protein